MPEAFGSIGRMIPTRAGRRAKRCLMNERANVSACGMWNALSSWGKPLFHPRYRPTGEGNNGQDRGSSHDPFVYVTLFVIAASSCVMGRESIYCYS